VQYDRLVRHSSNSHDIFARMFYHMASGLAGMGRQVVYYGIDERIMLWYSVPRGMWRQ